MDWEKPLSISGTSHDDELQTASSSGSGAHSTLSPRVRPAKVRHYAATDDPSGATGETSNSRSSGKFYGANPTTRAPAGGFPCIAVAVEAGSPSLRSLSSRQ